MVELVGLQVPDKDVTAIIPTDRKNGTRSCGSASVYVCSHIKKWSYFSQVLHGLLELLFYSQKVVGTGFIPLDELRRTKSKYAMVETYENKRASKETVASRDFEAESKKRTEEKNVGHTPTT